MGEILVLHHAAGPANLGGSPQHGFTINPQLQLGAGTGTSAFGQFSVSRIDPLPISGMTNPPGTGVPIPFLASVTGSGTAQSVNVATTSLITEDGWWIVDPGTSSQECVLIATASIIDATHVSFISQKSHTTSCVMLKIVSVFTKYLIASLTSIPMAGLTNFNFIRMTGFPTGCYDQYLVRGSYGSLTYDEDDVVPWVNGNSITPSVSSIPPQTPLYDPTMLSSTGNPTNGVSLYSGTITGGAGAYPNVQVQMIFTTTPEPDTSGVLYRYFWDEL